MKNTILYASLAVGIFVGGASFAAQTAGGGSAGGTTTIVRPAVAPRTGVTPVIPNTSAGRPGTVIKPNTANMTATGVGTMTTNQFAGATNSFPNTNNLAGTNGLKGINGSNNVTAIVNPATQVSPNSNPNVNVNGNMVIPDQATTPSDRVLLTTLSQGVRSTLSIVPNGNMPVHFLINNGTVTDVGTVKSAEQSQSVLSQVRQTPGVLSVINDMNVASPLTEATSANRTGQLGTQTDAAVSRADKTLLTAVQQEAALQLGVTSLAQMPVHFSIQNGVVGVTGQVQSLQEKQALLASLARTRGITRVVDNVSVAPNATGALPSATPSINNTMNPHNLSPTGGSNTIFLNSTNSSGF
jgi:osmotically-inducible protein OsmY